MFSCHVFLSFLFVNPTYIEWYIRLKSPFFLLQGCHGTVLQLWQCSPGVPDAHSHLAPFSPTCGSFPVIVFSRVSATALQLCRKTFSHPGSGVLWRMGSQSHQPGIPKDTQQWVSLSHRHSLEMVVVNYCYKHYIAHLCYRCVWPLPNWRQAKVVCSSTAASGLQSVRWKLPACWSNGWSFGWWGQWVWPYRQVGRNKILFEV